MSPTPLGTADSLNQLCFCRTLDRERLLGPDILRTRSNLFADCAVFISADMAWQVRQAVAVLHRTLSLPPSQAQALALAPAIAQVQAGPSGVFMGFDFHLGPQGPRLIEVNTNAGGAWLNALLARAHRACGPATEGLAATDSSLDSLEDTFLAMFRREWQHQRGEQPLGRLAIVDDDPPHQYLWPEFERCRQWLQGRGVQALVCDAAELRWQGGRLWAGDLSIDMVYNRLTDFYLEEPAHLALRQAHEAGAVVLTPHPRVHATQASKRNLVPLSDPAVLQGWGVSEADRAVLAAVVPRTVPVTPQNQDELWADRRQWFFKPVGGHGAKAVYRGDKLTRRVWAEVITPGDFVAQALVPAGARQVEVDGVLTALKFDLRAYAFEGQVQLLAARIYAGQATNFRTPGGGFAPVVTVP